jgi:hypothetical protein
MGETYDGSLAERRTVVCIWKEGVRMKRIVLFVFSLLMLVDVAVFAPRNSVGRAEPPPPSGSVSQNCRNLLRNASFTQRTNNTIPDFWDLYRVAAIYLKSLHDEFSVDDEMASPVPNTKVLKIVNSRRDFSFMHVVPTRIQSRVRAGNYTISVYAKSANANSTLRIFRSWSDPRPSRHTLGSNWKRINLTFRYSAKKSRFLQPILNFPDHDTYYIAAPQLEPGSVVNDYQPACADAPGPSFTFADSAAVSDSYTRLTRPLSGETMERQAKAKHFIIVDGKPFFIIGIAVGNWGVPPDWYFSELRTYGINTIFYLGASGKKYDIGEVETFVSAAARHDLKVIIGAPLAGYKPRDWRARLTRFADLVERFKGNPTIIGWYPIDEPEASTWTTDDIKEVTDTIKGIDPLRILFINWAYNGVPAQVGEEPRGTLNATDVYSIDDYPFAVYRKGLLGFTDTTLRALETARLKNKISHSWLQIYGDTDAWREPTGDELNYMAYLNLIYGGMYSYWNTKSNSAATWSRVAKINAEASFLARTLFTDSNAVEIKPPTFENGFLYSIWKKSGDLYLLVLNTRTNVGSFELGLSQYVSGHPQVKSIFENTLKPLKEPAGLSDIFQGFESKVYVLTQ